MQSSNASKIALMGFGEAGRAFAQGWPEAVRSRLVAYDIKLDAPSSRGQIADACETLGVAFADSLGQALDGAGHVFSLVTADCAHAAASAAAEMIADGGLFFDCNSCSPATKKASAAKIDTSGGRYVDVAVMSPVHPKLHRSPLLISGPHVDAALIALTEFDMFPAVAGAEVGQASAIKMLRSVMIKGLEALTAECMLAARRAGVEEAVLASLQASDPGFDWTRRSAYNLERMMVHGERRAAEMREVASTVREFGLADRMAQATAEWQAEIAGLGLDGGKSELADRTDRILERLGR